MTSDQDLYHELTCSTLSDPNPSFLHQHVVDAYAAQHAHENAKPIGIVFALVGLYLYVEKNFTGKQVQRIHMHLAKSRRDWPRLTPPRARGAVGVSAVLAASPGRAREEAIRSWCASVWEVWKDNHSEIRALVKELTNIE